MRREASVQRLLGMEAIERGCAFLADGGAAAALACTSLPLALRGDDEALAIVAAVAAATRETPMTLHAVCEAGPLDADAYLAAHAAASATEPAPALRRLAERQRAFVAGLAGATELLERRCWLVVRLDPDVRAGPWWRVRRPDAGAGSLAEADRRGRAARLAAACRDLSAALARAAVACRRLDDGELAALLYRWVLPGPAERQPLPADLGELATGAVAYAGPPRPAVPPRRPHADPAA